MDLNLKLHTTVESHNKLQGTANVFFIEGICNNQIDEYRYLHYVFTHNSFQILIYTCDNVTTCIYNIFAIDSMSPEELTVNAEHRLRKECGKETGMSLGIELRSLA